MDLGLSGRVFVVTGGTAGLGLATATVLVHDGASVVVSARDPERVAAAAHTLGDQAVGVVADNADPTATERLVETAYEHFGRLDGALVSVGGPPATTAMDASDDQWRAAFESVFLGAVRIARTVAQRLDHGAIGFVLSTSVKTPIPNLAISNGLRPGLAMVAKTLADELGPRGVRVFGLLPGLVSTARTAELYRDEDTRRGSEVAIPLRRFGDPAEFGRVAAFLLSPAASYVTGCVVPVDGGSLRAL